VIEQFNSLRSDGNRGKLSYLLVTKKLPHVLGRNLELEMKSKFFDLIRHNHFALEPYSWHDARQMLRHLNSTVTSPVPPGELARMQELGGGHARLLRILFDLWIEEGPPPTNHAEEYLVNQPRVRRECERVLRGLHDQEGEAMVLVARGARTPEIAETIDHLKRRGILNGRQNSNEFDWFSPLMRVFLQTIM
jgi:hypothetical protein